MNGFHRDIKLVGQQVFESPETPAKVAGLGILLVEGPNDVIRFDTLGVPAVAICSLS